MLHPDQRPKVTVEDLIRLKRAERPAPEFWSTFERELRQKQLSALLDRRPWWQELPQFLARRAYLPVGATAILAFTLVSVRYYLPAQVAQGDTAGGANATATVNRAVIAKPVVSAPTAALPDRATDENLRSSDLGVTPASTTATPAPADPRDENLAVETPARSVDSPSSRYIATNLDRLEKTDPELVQAVMGSRLSAPARVQTASLPLSEFASVPTNMARRSRILAQYVERPLNPEPSAPEIVRERLARRLGEGDINDRISRIGLKGDQASLGLTLRL